MNADVYKGDHQAGTITRYADHVEFAYDPRYGGDPVASTLPVQPEPYTAPAGQLPAFFVGLLPEGRRLTALRQLLKVAPDDDLSQLLAVGGDTIGDVRIIASGAEPHDPPHVMEHRSWIDVDLADLFTQSISSSHDAVAIPGVQPKISGRMISFPAAGTTGPAIIKLDPPEYRRLVANESAMLGVAARLGYPAPTHRLVQDHVGSTGLVIDRFDRGVADGHLVRYAVEDGCQTLGLYPADKYNLDTLDAIGGLAALCTAPAVAALQLVERFVFSYLVGDGDLHARNLSVWRRPDGVWEPSPWYDIVCTAIYGDMTLAAPLHGDTNIREIGRRRLVEATRVLRIPDRAVERMLDLQVPRIATTLASALAQPPFTDFPDLPKISRTLARRADLLIV